MKKAFLDQLFLGFLLLTGVVTFVATVDDERSIRDKAYELQSLVTKSSQAMARSYERNMDMCLGRTTNINILNETPLGKEVLTLASNAEISLEYNYYDKFPLNSDGSVGDGQPDTVITTISGYKENTFWYRFFDKDSFNIGTISYTELIDAPSTLTFSFGGGITAGNSVVGTYQLDENDCVINTELIMGAQKSTDEGTVLAENIESPPTYLFIIPKAGKLFTDLNNGDQVTIDGGHCIGDENVHDITIGSNESTSLGIYFEQNKLNNTPASETDSIIRVIPTNVWDIYYDYVEISEGNSGKHTYEEFLEYCYTDEFNELKEEINNDDNPTNDILDCITDPNGQYQYGMEDNASVRGDDDYNDVIIDATEFAISNSIDQFTVDETTREIIFNDDYCQNDPLNTPPSLTVNGCTVTTLEDTETSAISWSANDSDGTIESTAIMADKGSATLNINGTITYIPLLNDNGIETDSIYISVTDDDGALARYTCDVTITEVNDAPTISGIPDIVVSIDNLYDFTPTAVDVDGDSLTFSIKNIPNWATFNESTGQLSGTPTSSDVNIYSDIVISVSDGRGGTASLPSFNIEVSSTNGSPYVVTPILDQTISVSDTYSYDLSTHFADPDGDILTYKVKIIKDNNIQGSLDLSTNSLIESIDISSAYVGDVYTLEVTVSDGTYYATDTYTLTITDSYYHTFDSDNQDWLGRAYWAEVDGDGKLRITSNTDYNDMEASYTFSFGTGNAYKNVIIEFDMYHYGGWDNSGTSEDFFKVKLNNSLVVEDQYNGSNSSTVYGPFQYTSISGTTDINGNVEIGLIINVTHTNEIAYIDNVSVKLQ